MRFMSGGFPACKARPALHIGLPFSDPQLITQEYTHERLRLPESPNFTAAAVLPDGSIKGDFSLSDYAGKYVVIFFYRSTFTFVCPSEILAHNSRVDDSRSAA